jgi:hypothetical protein
LPKLFSIGQYVVFFWSNENGEPIHVHVAIGRISPSATKVWLTQGGGAIVANNKSKISQADLNEILGVICDNHTSICKQWKDFFSTDTVNYYC